MKASQDRSHFFRGFVVLFIGSLIGKVAGLAREVVFAAAFGSGPIASGFKSAQSSVLVSANLVTGDVLSSAFVPAYAETRAADPLGARRLIWGYLLGYGGAMTGVALLVFTLRRDAMSLLIPGASLQIQALGADFLGVLAWCIPLFGVASIAGYALATTGKYTATSLRSTLQTAGLLIGTMLAVTLRQPVWLASGFVLAWLIYATWCVVLLVRFDLLGRLDARGLPAALRVVLRNLWAVLPLAVIPAGIQIAAVVQRIIASHGPDALIASVDYAQTLSDSLVTLVSVPLGFVGLTQMATLDEEGFKRASSRILSSVVVIGLPLTFVVLPLTGTIVRVVYGRGNFGQEAALLTSQVAFGLFCGIAVQIVGYALTRALTARRRNRAVLVITVSGLAAEVGVQSLALMLHAPVFIGLGVTVYGLVLTVVAARLLHLHRLLLRLAVVALPAVGVSVGVLVVPGLPVVLQLVVIALAWALTLAVARTYRGVIAEVIALFRRSRSRTPTEERTCGEQREVVRR
ncbi:lipid II flippase MurJ [Amnibacterium endophyticum]|uniref:Lipid II flippase MurJ n=1 Tax=Amnibacterium endophyticum TaxID=2109337 RepID=A0ABW4LBZ0_9MICO